MRSISSVCGPGCSSTRSNSRPLSRSAASTVAHGCDGGRTWTTMRGGADMPRILRALGRRGLGAVQEEAGGVEDAAIVQAREAADQVVVGALPCRDGRGLPQRAQPRLGRVVERLAEPGEVVGDPPGPVVGGGPPRIVA